MSSEMMHQALHQAALSFAQEKQMNKEMNELKAENARLTDEKACLAQNNMMKDSLLEEMKSRVTSLEKSLALAESLLE
jgi:hypothetical protein